jgi:hypothetical protein
LVSIRDEMAVLEAAEAIGQNLGEARHAVGSSVQRRDSAASLALVARRGVA